MKTILLTQGKIALVDDDDYEWISKSKWSAHRSKKREGAWYAMRTQYIGIINGKQKSKFFYMHREIMKLSDPKRQCDHIDGNGLNNQRSNLRVCSNTQNQVHKGKCRPNATSKFKGVSFDKEKKKWRAYIKKDGRQIELGRFADEEDAAIYYNVAAQLFFGEFAYLNPV